MTTITRDYAIATGAVIHGKRVGERNELLPKLGFPGGASGKEPPANAGDTRDVNSILSQEDPLEEGMATHSRILTWRIPWTEESGGLQSIGLQRVGHD